MCLRDFTNVNSSSIRQLGCLLQGPTRATLIDASNLGRHLDSKGPRTHRRLHARSGVTDRMDLLIRMIFTATLCHGFDDLAPETTRHVQQLQAALLL